MATRDRSGFVKAAALHPGYKADDWNKVCHSLEDILINKNDEFREERITLRTKIYQYEDTGNSARLVEKVMELLEN